MRLEDCILDTDVVVRKSEYAGPDDTWKDAHSKGIIPTYLFRFYCKADYFQFGKTPPYLQDKDCLLFPFIEAMSRGILDSFLEAEELVSSMPDLRDRGYSPVKASLGASWNRKADQQLLRSFKYLLVNLNASLDQFSEISAVLLFPALSKIPPGRASFVAFKKFVRKQQTLNSNIVTPQNHFADQLRQKLLPLIDRSGTDKDWLELLQFYRNKLAHLGTSVFQYMCFHDKGAEFYTFPPRVWPRFHKQDIGTSSTHASGGTSSLESIARKQLIHCDLIEYSSEVISAVRELLNVGFECVCDVYDMLKNVSANQQAADAIMQQSESYDFEHF